VITRIPKLRVPAPAAPGPLSDGTWIVATSPALPMPMPHTRSRYSVLAAALFTRRSPLPSPTRRTTRITGRSARHYQAGPPSQAVAVFGDLKLFEPNAIHLLVAGRDGWWAADLSAAPEAPFALMIDASARQVQEPGWRLAT
jgi:hypothetical protein